MSKPRVSIISCTARYGGIDILLNSLKRQTFQDFRCLLIDELYDFRHKEVVEYFDKYWKGSYGEKLIHVKPLPKKPGMFWNLSQSMNQGLALSGGDIVMFLQDYLWMEPFGVQLFVEHIDMMGDCLVSGVGHKAQEPSWALHLKGKISIFTDYSNEHRSEISERDKHWAYDKPEGVWFRDPRIKGYGCTLANPIEWEGNYSAVTKKICEEIGGFDEEFDAGWGYDNVNFAERALMAGYDIWLDEHNEHIGFAHELFGSDIRAAAPNNMLLWERKCEAVQRGLEPFKVNYLDEVREKLRLGEVSCV